MSSAALRALLIGLALLCAPASAWAGPNQVRTTGDGSGGVGASNAVPPVAAGNAGQSKVGEAVDILGDVNTVTDVLHTTAGAIGESKGLVDKSMGAASKNFFEGKAKVLERAGTAITFAEAAAKYQSGDTTGAAKQVVAAGIDMAVDVCYEAASKAACAYMSAPSAGATFTACDAASKFIKFCADKVIENQLGGSLGEYVVGTEAYDQVSQLFNSSRAQQQQQTEDQTSRFTQAQVSNDQQAITNAAAAPSSASGQNDDGTAFANSLMAGVMMMSPQTSGPSPMPQAATVAPSAPAAPGGPCHPGHDENAHPGGCHDGSGVSR